MTVINFGKENQEETIFQLREKLHKEEEKRKEKFTAWVSRGIDAE